MLETTRAGLIEAELPSKRVDSGMGSRRRSLSPRPRTPGGRVATLEDYREMSTRLLSMIPTVLEALVSLHRPHRGRGTVLFRHVLHRLPESLLWGGANGVTIFVPVDVAFVGAGLASWRPECLDVHVLPVALSLTDLQGCSALNTQGMLRPSSVSSVGSRGSRGGGSRGGGRGGSRAIASRAGDRYGEDAGAGLPPSETMSRVELAAQKQRRRDDTDSGARSLGMLGRDRLRVQTDVTGKVKLWVDGDTLPVRKATILKTDIMCRGGTILHLVDKILF